MNARQKLVLGMGTALPARAKAIGTGETTLTEFYRWWFVDERTGERDLTPYKLSRVDAQRAFPGAQPDLSTREIRHLAGTGNTPANGRRGGHVVLGMMKQA